MPEEPHIPPFSVIPMWVLLNKEVEPGAKLLYAFLNVLPNQYGYVFPTNEYLAKIFKVNKSTIKKWLKSLKESKFIKINEKKGENKMTCRSIYLEMNCPPNKEVVEGNKIIENKGTSL